MKLLVGAVAALFSVSAAGAQAYKLSVTLSANGKTTEPETLHSFRFDSVAGAAAKESKLRPIRIEKVTGPSDGILQLGAQTGTKIRAMTFGVTTADGTQHMLQINSVAVTSAQNMQPPAGPAGGARPFEVIVLRYDSMEVDGKPATPENTRAWNLKK